MQYQTHFCLLYFPGAYNLAHAFGSADFLKKICSNWTACSPEKNHGFSFHDVCTANSWGEKWVFICDLWFIDNNELRQFEKLVKKKNYCSVLSPTLDTFVHFKKHSLAEQYFFYRFWLSIIAKKIVHIHYVHIFMATWKHSNTIKRAWKMLQERND